MTPQSEGLQGQRMGRAEVDELLETVRFGVLSLARDGRPYGLPLSFGFDGEDQLYFQFIGQSDEGRKLEYAEDAERASFLAYDVVDASEWRSVIVEGAIDRIDQNRWDAAREAMAENAFRPDLLIEVDREQDPRVWQLEIEDWSGRQVQA
jgi:nitroimidazol reductase NimA-like FMN-containing flavoprotein (pyridoxamine 5'-phosphate oxidase superfamily)